MARRALLAVTCLLAASALAGCSDAGTPVNQTVRLGDDNKFNPATVNVAPGETVRFTNEGQKSHTVTIHPPSGSTFDKTLTPGQSVDYKFEQAGSYHVECRFHHSMGMEMTVVAK